MRFLKAWLKNIGILALFLSAAPAFGLFFAGLVNVAGMSPPAAFLTAIGVTLLAITGVGTWYETHA